MERGNTLLVEKLVTAISVAGHILPKTLSFVALLHTVKETYRLSRQARENARGMVKLTSLEAR